VTRAYSAVIAWPSAREQFTSMTAVTVDT